jgi:hypothetical protein
MRGVSASVHFGTAADAEETDAERLGDLAQIGQMPVGFLAGLVQVFERRAGQLELAAGLQRNRALAGMLGKADDIAGVDDRLPAELFCAMPFRVPRCWHHRNREPGCCRP